MNYGAIMERKNFAPISVQPGVGLHDAGGFYAVDVVYDCRKYFMLRKEIGIFAANILQILQNRRFYALNAGKCTIRRVV